VAGPADRGQPAGDEEARHAAVAALAPTAQELEAGALEVLESMVGARASVPAG
jgi:hypothetical protein